MIGLPGGAMIKPRASTPMPLRGNRRVRSIELATLGGFAMVITEVHHADLDEAGEREQGLGLAHARGPDEREQVPAAVDAPGELDLGRAQAVLEPQLVRDLA